MKSITAISHLRGCYNTDFIENVFINLSYHFPLTSVSFALCIYLFALMYLLNILEFTDWREQQIGRFPGLVLLVVPKSPELCFLATPPLLVCRQNSLSWYMECAFFLFDKRLCRCRCLYIRFFFHRGILAQSTTLQSIK